MKAKVLLTGVTGFLGSHTAIQLLNKGYSVLGTLRDLGRAEDIKQAMAKHTDNIGNLAFAEAELSDAEIWRQLTKGVDCVHHIASPFPAQLPENEEDIIRPAKEGALNVLKASSENGVRRVVMTSSTTAMIYGKAKGERSQTFTEADWTDVRVKNDSTSYHRSKTIAEKVSWDYVTGSDGNTELTTICPGLILGPVLEKDYGTSAGIILNFLTGSMKATPNLGYDTVDVRSVAQMHLMAMESPQAAGERFICSNGFVDFKQILDMLRERYPERNITTQIVPDEVIRNAAQDSTAMQRLLVDLGAKRRVDNSKAKEVLGWKPIDNKEAILSCAESIFEVGLIP